MSKHIEEMTINQKDKHLLHIISFIDDFNKETGSTEFHEFIDYLFISKNFQPHFHRNTELFDFVLDILIFHDLTFYDLVRVIKNSR